jgi:hypothetical protein
VVLHGDDAPVSVGRSQDGAGVQRFDGGDVQHGNVDVVGGEPITWRRRVTSVALPT